ncbi:hypothetical protein SAMN05444483_106107 [Salegentibacter echinorum]|uniref:Uncharacterized protein n=1 Tax=Salegentibacter echinorum TaxID=1073325 RepID=A0A1M5I2B8_SALEC|nr:hypothetical protein SAMN05444483_106107 [Salegentibacter echinorum]
MLRLVLGQALIGISVFYFSLQAQVYKLERDLCAILLKFIQGQGTA